MKIDFKTEVKDDHVRLTCQGTYSNKALFSIYASALDRAANEGLNAVLIDIRSMDGNTPTTMERHEHGMTVARIQSDHNARVLIVVVGKEPIMDPHRHCETVAMNRGAYGKAFTDIDLATTWLENTVTGSNLN